MKLEDLLKECPKCGCKDKTVNRDIEPVHKAHASTKDITCSECGYVFETGKDKQKK